MKLFTSKFFGFLLILLVNSAYGQNPIPHYATSEDFFPHNPPYNVSDIHADSTGYIYFANSTGLSRFNGKKLDKSWKRKNPEDQISFHFIEESYDGTMLMCGPFGVYYLKKDSLISFGLPDSLVETPMRKYESVYLDRNDVLHVAPKGMGYFTVSPKGNVTQVIGRSSGINGYGVKKVDGKWIQFSIIQPGAVQESFVQLDRNNKVVFTAEYTNRGRYRSSIAQYKDGTVLFSNGGQDVMEFRENKFIKKHTFPYLVVSLFIDRKQQLWIGSFGAGAYRTSDKSLTQFDHFFGNQAAAVVAEDKDGGIWFKSNVVGFGYISPTSVPHFSSQTGHDDLASITRLFVGENNTIALTNTGKIFNIDANNQITTIGNELELFSNLRNTTVTGTCYDKTSNKLVLVRGPEVKLWHNSQWTGLSYGGEFLQNYPLNLIQAIGNSRIVGIANNQLFEIIDDSLFVISEHSSQPILRSCLNDNNEIVVTRPDGIWKLDKKRFVQVHASSNSIIADNIVGMNYLKGNLWIQPHKHPLIRIVKGRYETIVDSNGQEVKLSGIQLAPNGDIWAPLYPEYTTLCRIQQNGDSYKVNYFTFDEMATKGYFAGSIGATDEHLFFGSFFGFYKEKITHLRPSPTPIVIVPSFYINTKLVDTQKSFKLKYNENNITVTFDAISFLRRGLEYQYLMTGLDEEWQTISASEIRFINLKPGTYELKLRARTENGAWQEPLVFPVEISTPFWETWWFRIGIVLLGLLLIFALFSWRVRRARKKEKEKSKVALELARLEMRALKAQINPHFIFNSITSAMFYLAKNENDKVESYLQRFSKLVRKVLESSDKSTISLMEEMELIGLYVKLESEQFEGEPVTLDVSYEGNGIENAQIPPTLIQPYIENAIQHGLRTKTGIRMIQISFKLERNELKVQIQDNGIGRAAAKKEKPFKENKSFGMLISSRRIELLNKNSISHVQVDDLFDENNNPVGTRVSFTIPFITEEITLNVAN